PALQPADEADHAAAESRDARLFALEHGTRAATRSAAVRAGDPHRGRALPRSAASAASTLFIRRPRLVQRADPEDLASFSRRADAGPQKRGAAAHARCGAGANHRLPRRRALSAGPGAHRARTPVPGADERRSTRLSARSLRARSDETRADVRLGLLRLARLAIARRALSAGRPGRPGEACAGAAPAAIRRASCRRNRIAATPASMSARRWR